MPDFDDNLDTSASIDATSATEALQAQRESQQQAFERNAARLSASMDRADDRRAAQESRVYDFQQRQFDRAASEFDTQSRQSELAASRDARRVEAQASRVWENKQAEIEQGASQFDRRAEASDSAAAQSEDRESWSKKLFGEGGMTWAVGWGGAETIHAIGGAMSPWASGELHQQNVQMMQGIGASGSVLGSIGGAVIGNLLAPGVGGMAGQFIGGALGGQAGSVGTSYYDSHIGMPERTGEILGAGRGGQQAVDDVVNALKNALTPAITELASAMTNVARIIPVGPGAASGFANLQTGLGFAFTPTIEAVSGMLASTPALHPLLQQWGSTGGLDSGTAASLAMTRAAMGDPTGATAFNAIVEGNRQAALNISGTTAPTGMGRMGSAAGQWLTAFGSEIASMWYEDFGGVTPGEIKNEAIAQGYGSSEADVRRYALGQGYNSQQTQGFVTALFSPNVNAGVADRLDDIASRSLAAQFSASEGILQSKTAITGASIERAGGDTAAQYGTALAASLPSINTAIGAKSTQWGLFDQARNGYGGTTAQVAAARAAIAANPGDPLAHAALQNALSADAANEQQETDLASQAIDLRSTRADIPTSIWQAQYGETMAVFGFRQSSTGLAVAKGFYGGMTPTQLQPTRAAQISAQGAEANYLSTITIGPGRTMEDVLKAHAQAQGIYTDIQGEQYGNNVTLPFQYAQSKSALGVATAETFSTQASLFGTPEQRGGAASGEVSAYKNAIHELSRELQSGKLDATDYIATQNQLAETMKALSQATYDAATVVASSTASISESNARGQFSQMGTAGLLQGSSSGAYSSAMAGGVSDLRASAASNRALAAAVPGTPQAAEALALAQQQDEAATQAVNTLSVTYSGAERTQFAIHSGTLSRMTSSFTQPGNVNDARMTVYADFDTRRADLYKQYQQQLGLPGADPNALLAAFTEKDQSLQTEQAQVGYAADRQYFERLPSLAVGRGSDSWRFMPTQAAMAGQIERMGFGSLAARNAGYYNSASYDAVKNMPGSSLLTAGRDWDSIEPGNQSTDALHRSGGKPVPVTIEGGVITINIPQLNFKQSIPLTINKSAVSPTYTSGLKGPGQ